MVRVYPMENYLNLYVECFIIYRFYNFDNGFIVRYTQLQNYLFWVFFFFNFPFNSCWFCARLIFFWIFMLFFLFRWKLNSKQKFIYYSEFHNNKVYMHRPAAHHKHNTLKWFIFLVKLHESVHLLFWIPTKKSLNWSFFFFFFFLLLLFLFFDFVCRALMATRSVVELSHSLSLLFFFL